MKKFISICVLSFFFSLAGRSQLLFFQDTYKGGVTSDGVSYYGMDYMAADTINFQVHISAGSSIRKAFLLSWRFIYIVGTKPKRDSPLPVIFNGNTLSFDSTDVVTTLFHCDNSNPSTDCWMVAKDVTALTQIAGNKLITPDQAQLMINDTSRHYVYDGFILLVMYENSSLSPVNSCIFLNNKTFSSTMAQPLTGINPIFNGADVGLSIWTQDVFSFPSVYNALMSYTINTSTGNYTLGTLDQYKGNNTWSETLPGSFYYENSTLYGLVDDKNTPFIDSTNALANIKTYISNNTTSFTLTSTGHYVNSACSDTRDAYFLTYNSTCPTINNVPLQTHSYCMGGSVPLTSTQAAGNTYAWYPGLGLSDSTIYNPVASPTVSTNYIVTVTDVNGCHHTEHHKVKVYPLPKTISLSITNVVCGVSLGNVWVSPATGGTPPYTYNIGSGGQAGNTFSNLNPSSYTLTITDSAGCTYNQPFTVTEVNPANALFSTQPDTGCLNNSVSFVNGSGNVNQYNWLLNGVSFSSSQSPSYTFTNSGSFTVTLIAWENLPQCSDTVSHTLFVHYCPPDSFSLTAPNVFTPNGDGINDTWQPIVNEYGYNFNSFQLSIYDRWGLKVFESSSARQGWDGHTTSGTPCTEGSYFYILNYSASSSAGSKQQTLKGFLQLAR